MSGPVPDLPPGRTMLACLAEGDHILRSHVADEDYAAAQAVAIGGTVPPCMIDVFEAGELTGCLVVLEYVGTPDTPEELTELGELLGITDNASAAVVLSRLGYGVTA